MKLWLAAATFPPCEFLPNIQISNDYVAMILFTAFNISLDKETETKNMQESFALLILLPLLGNSGKFVNISVEFSWRF